MALTKVTYPMIETATFEPIQLVVGNDPSYPGTYDFSDLKDAIRYCTGTMLASGKMSSTGASSSARYQINIPAGTHTFSAMSFRAANLSGIQVWGSGEATTTIKCELGGTTDGTWLDAVWSIFSDWGGFTLIPGDDVTVITNPATVCQPWYGTPTPPWSPNKEMVFMSFTNCTVGRLWGTTFDGNTLGCRLATGLNCSGTLANIDDLSFKNIRDCVYSYDGSTVSILYSGITATNVYNGIITHNATTFSRLVNLSGILNAGAPYAGGVAFDSFGGNVELQNKAAGVDNTITGFDIYAYMSGGRFFDETPQSQRSNINKVIDRYPVIPGKYMANIISLDVDFLPDADVLSKDVITYNDAEDYGTGLVTYVGDNTGGRTFGLPANVKQVTVRDLTSNVSVTCIRGQLATVSGNNAVWISSADGLTRVYPAMNATGVNYELIWSR